MINGPLSHKQEILLYILSFCVNVIVHYKIVHCLRVRIHILIAKSGNVWFSQFQSAVKCLGLRLEFVLCQG